MKNYVFTTQISGWGELDGSGTQCCVHGHFGAFILRTGAAVRVGRSRAGCSWAVLVGHQCTVTDKLCEYYTQPSVQGGASFLSRLLLSQPRMNFTK